MKKAFIAITIIGLLSQSHTVAQKINIDSLEVMIGTIMNDFEVPGLSLGIVQNDSIIYLKGFGTRQIKRDLPVDENTIFGIGSISKSFTALTLGILVDEGKIDWDDKVRMYLPYFELYDPYVSDNFTIRDLLTHRSGLRDVSGGMLWYHSDYSRVDLIKRLRYLKPVSGYRDKPAYQNVMFVVAAEIVSAVSGMSWDEFVRLNVFERLQMRNTTSISFDRESNTNLAQPHVWNDDYKRIAVIQEKGDNLASAGFIYSSAIDMCHYIQLLLNDGISNQDSLVGHNVIKEIFTPQIVYTSGPPFQNEFTSYGFGWWLTPKNGHKIIEHSGGIDGMTANVVMIKDLKTGFVILTNVEKEPAMTLLTAYLLKTLLNDSDYDIYTAVKSYRDKNLIKKKESTKQVPDYKNTQPSLPVTSYAGTYSDIMYGDITISLNKKSQLEVAFSHTPIFSGELEHWQFDTFLVDWYDPRIPDGFFTFNFNANREIIGITLDQKNLLDVDFSELDIRKKTD